MTMAAPDSGRIGEQHDAYRRGLVLGLTMAEVGILIIFVLMLLIAFEEYRQREAKKAREGTTPVRVAELVELRRADVQIQQIAKELGVAEDLPPEDFRKLIRAIQPIAKSGVGQQALAEARAEIERQRAVRDELTAALQITESGKTDEVIRRIEEQSYKMANQEGQLKRVEKQLEQFGQGKGVRPCWVQPDGTIDYLYDVVLTSGGIRMKEYQHLSRAAERALLPMPKTDPDETLSEAEFLSRTRPLYESSVADNCRFFVYLYDGTGAQEKTLYKRLRRTVEGHFYINPFQQDAAPPF
jgi:hypothetical protein